jgi:hypothetical protein
MSPKDVQCPYCGAEVGRPCRTPSEWKVFGGGFHKERKDLYRLRRHNQEWEKRDGHAGGEGSGSAQESGL